MPCDIFGQARVLRRARRGNVARRRRPLVAGERSEEVSGDCAERNSEPTGPEQSARRDGLRVGGERDFRCAGGGGREGPPAEHREWATSAEFALSVLKKNFRLRKFLLKRVTNIRPKGHHFITRAAHMYKRQDEWQRQRATRRGFRAQRRNSQPRGR